MLFIESLLTGIGFMALCFGVSYVILNAVEFYYTTKSEIRSCKRDIERLEGLLKALQCKRPS